MASIGSFGTVYLIDAYALLFQVFYAIRGMSSPSGLPTNALFGFTRDLLFLHQEIKPDYLVCIFDEGEPEFRTKVFPEYKANRTEMPEDLRIQLEPIGQLLDAMNIPNIRQSGYEADDVIATIAAEAANKGMEVFICSSDKDLRQVISDNVKIYNLRKNSILDRDTLQDDWGITPEQVVDLQALVGDSVDNIDGVPGVGLKTAAKLLQEYTTADNLLNNIEKVSGTKRRENLRASVDLVERNRHLVRLLTNVPMELTWDEWRRQDVDAPRLLDLFREWGFHRFADQISALAEPNGKPKGPSNRPNVRLEQDGLFDNIDEDVRPSRAQPESPPEENWTARYHLVDSNEKFDELLKTLKQQERFAIDLETTALEPWRADIVGYAIAFSSGEAWYIAVRGPKGSSVVDAEAALDRLRPLLENDKIAKVNQNIKYDALVLRQYGTRLRGIAGDSMVADYLLNAGEKNRSLQNLSRAYLRHEVIPITELIGKNGPKQLTMDAVDPQRVAEYAGEDADVAWRLCEQLEAQLKNDGLWELYQDVEIPLIDVLIDVEHNGILLDVDLLKKLGEELGAQLADLEAEIHDLAGEEFKIGSLKQLRRILFDKLKLPTRRKTGITGAPSTDQDTLEWLATQGHELPKRLLQHRRISKLKGTYIDALPKLVNPKTSRLHTSFHQTVAATGRLSSSDPNLQNIPIRTELGGQIRQAFLPEPGWHLVSADYSQIELRLLAHFSNDEDLRRAFQEDRDIHSLVAAQIYGVNESEVDPNMRRMAKTVNFGVIYGMSAFGLAQRLEISKAEAESFIEKYFQQYPRVLEYQQNLLERCRQNGYVATLLGRRRAFQSNVIRANSTYRHRNQAEREAINMEIQGSAADLIKVAMLNIYRRMQTQGVQSRMLLQIHDELVFEVPPHELAAMAGLVGNEMTTALSDRLQVPLKVDLSVGANWLDVEEYLEVE